ncbi:MAG: hypothetical protein ABR936_14690 [Bacteroidota bacterium]|jgi:hypothetical protein
MKRIIYTEQRVNFVRLVFILILAITFAFPIYACTIFVLTNGQGVIFGNNEDWINPKTRIWFVPAGDGYYGCVYVGYDDGWARGGMNTEGLACDWVGGFNENWQADAVTCVRGNPTERMLESCATVEDAIAFFQRHKESDFMRAKIFVADRNGMSVIIGVRDGKLRFERSERSRGFGYAFQTFDECFAKDSEITITNSALILHACLQKGKYATKYSNIFDLKSGDIYLYQFHQHVDSIRMNLVVELAKGGHYFDMVQIHRQFSMPVMPLLMNMNRLVIDDFPPISDPEPKVTNHIRAVMEDAISGKMHAEDYHAELWSSISPIQKDIQLDLKRFGNFQSITLVECKTEKGSRTNRYRIEFDNIRALMWFELDDQDKIISFKSEATERKPGADLGE